MIFKYGNYVKESTNDFPFIMSENFKDVIKEIKHPISDMLLDLKTSNMLSLVDVDEDDNVSYILISKVNQILKTKNLTVKDFFDKNGIDEEEYEALMKRFWNSYRQTTKIGRLVKRLFDFLSESDITKFSNKYKIRNMDFSLFEIVEGYDIMKWYLENNYINEPAGTLGASCMKQPERNKFMELYALNPEKVKMLILHRSKDNPKIVGRALIWNVDEPKMIFMDRVYYISDDILEIFHNFARKNGIFYKVKQTYGRQPIADANDNMKYIDMKIYLKNIEYDYYPYIDTFQWLNIPKKMLSTSYTGYEVLLSKTNGKFKNVRTDDDYIVDYTGTRVPRRNVVWCEIGKLYAPKEMTVELKYIRSFAMKDYPGVTFSKCEDTWVRESDCYFSELENDYVIKNHARHLKYLNQFVSRKFADSNCKFSSLYEDYILEKDAVFSKYHYNNFIYKDNSVKVKLEDGSEDYIDSRYLNGYDRIIQKEGEYYLISSK